jgi:hypothetical protein
MLTEITYYPILGKPFIMYLGLLTLLCFVITAYIGMQVMKGKTTLKQHKLMVGISFLLAAVHAVLGVLAFF